jgi:hypothetical protein
MAQSHSTLSVLISSKQSEFAAERADIEALVRPLPLLVASVAELWEPGPQSVKTRSLEEALACAIYVGLFGCVYSEPAVSEYVEAASNPNREVLVYIRECPGRDPSLAAFLDGVTDPRTGRTAVTYSDWSQIRPRIVDHLWAAVQRMIVTLLRLGEAQRAMAGEGGSGTLKRKRLNELAALGVHGDPIALADGLKDALVTIRPRE